MKLLKQNSKLSNKNSSITPIKIQGMKLGLRSCSGRMLPLRIPMNSEILNFIIKLPNLTDFNKNSKRFKLGIEF